MLEDDKACAHILTNVGKMILRQFFYAQSPGEGKKTQKSLYNEPKPLVLSDLQKRLKSVSKTGCS